MKTELKNKIIRIIESVDNQRLKAEQAVERLVILIDKNFINKQE